MGTLFVQTLGVPESTRGVAVAPPTELRLMVTLVMAAAPGVTVTLTRTVSLRRIPEEGVVVASEIEGTVRRPMNKVSLTCCYSRRHS